MTEIEKAREAREKGYGCADEIKNSDAAAEKSRQLSAQVREVEVKEQMFERRVRAIAREEIEAHEDRLMHEAMHGEINQEGGDRNQLDRRQDREDKSPPAVEAPAAGDSIGGELSDMTALARRLTEALDEVVDNYSVPFGVYDQIDSALAEARKHKLIE